MKRASYKQQGGIALIEAMIAVLIFALGILGLVAMGGTAMASQTDARLRTEAAQRASEISSRIAVSVPHNILTTTQAAVVAATLMTFQHRPAGLTCAFSGADADPMTYGGAMVTQWVAKVNGGGLTGLPGAVAASEQILVTPGAANRIQVTVCWKSPADPAYRHHTLITYVD